MPSVKVTAQGMCHGSKHTPGLTFWHLPPNAARISYATEGALFTSAQLSTDNSAPSEILGPNETVKAPQRWSTHINMRHVHPVNRVQELCESRGGRPGLPVPNNPMASVDVKQHFNNPGE